MKYFHWDKLWQCDVFLGASLKRIKNQDFVDRLLNVRMKKIKNDNNLTWIYILNIKNCIEYINIYTLSKSERSVYEIYILIYLTWSNKNNQNHF